MEDVDLDEVNDRINQLKEIIEELQEARDFVFQFKINLSTFFQIRAKLLKMIIRFKSQCFSQKETFQLLGKCEVEIRELTDHAHKYAEELESEGNIGIIKYFNTEMNRAEDIYELKKSPKKRKTLNMLISPASAQSHEQPLLKYTKSVMDKRPSNKFNLDLSKLQQPKDSFLRQQKSFLSTLQTQESSTNCKQSVTEEDKEYGGMSKPCPEMSFEFSDCNKSMVVIQEPSAQKQARKRFTSKRISAAVYTDYGQDDFTADEQRPEINEQVRDIKLIAAEKRNVTPKSNALKTIDMESKRYEKIKYRVKLEKKLKEEEQRFENSQSDSNKSYYRGCQEYCAIF
ncbi:UNKNOWN [Stylonychia lemnae]|uniref:Uncharacterized protein n=1 Tax=Stylonychia lemnae TaxID=5949 RepID=A0A078AW74_STYLE|nr:UNKNOWN [Stylonychia lemnae]|eukprot:CDW85048.1 UNKNOWN [Stylonychia lemnae]